MMNRVDSIMSIHIQKSESDDDQSNQSIPDLVRESQMFWTLVFVGCRAGIANFRSRDRTARYGVFQPPRRGLFLETTLGRSGFLCPKFQHFSRFGEKYLLANTIGIMNEFRHMKKKVSKHLILRLFLLDIPQGGIILIQLLARIFQY
jgi:hypothetical protein